MPFLQDALPDIMSASSMRQLWELPLKRMLDSGKRPRPGKRRLRILVLTNACYGFGDVVFGMKIRGYIDSWYGDKVTVHIATTALTQFITVGEKVSNLIYLRSATGDGNCAELRQQYAVDAREFLRDGSELPVDLSKYDLFLIAPLTSDRTPDWAGVRSLIHTSTRFNTYFMSEYNMALDPDIAFPTGVGNGRLGLLFTSRGHAPRLASQHNPYTIMYVADYSPEEHLVPPCYQGFLALVTSTYKLPNLDVITAPWMERLVTAPANKRGLTLAVSSHYTLISSVTKEGGRRVRTVLVDRTLPDKEPVELSFRFDVLPLKFHKMASLYKHSLPHVLLTGDQSLTDFVGLRPDGVMYYQGLPWKQGLYTNLAVAMPQRYLASKRTSCGNVSAVGYRPSSVKFARTHDFRQLARPLMDAVVCLAMQTLEDQTMAAYQRAVTPARRSVLACQEAILNELTNF